MNKVYIIRHAEKPDGRSPHLFIRGRARAQGLAWLFEQYKDIHHIFASTSTKNSDRPYETIKPTAKVFKLKVNTKFADKEIKDLAKELQKKKYCDSNVIICWHHGKIPELIRALGFPSPYDKWPETVFDRIIMLDFETKTLANAPQTLLYGDQKL